MKYIIYLIKTPASFIRKSYGRRFISVEYYYKFQFYCYRQNAFPTWKAYQGFLPNEFIAETHSHIWDKFQIYDPILFFNDPLLSFNDPLLYIELLKLVHG